MPAAAVKPSLRLDDMFIGPKASVGGPVRPRLNTATQSFGLSGKLPVLAMGETSRTYRVKVKFYNPVRTTDGEGSLLEHVRR